MLKKKWKLLYQLDNCSFCLIISFLFFNHAFSTVEGEGRTDLPPEWNKQTNKVKQQEKGYSSWVATILTYWFIFFNLAKLIWFSNVTSQESLFWKQTFLLEES